MNCRRCPTAGWLALTLVALIASLAPAQSDSDLLIGSWNAQLASPGGPLRFGISILRDQEQWSAYLHNGPERIKVPAVQLLSDGRLELQIRHYDSTLTLARAESPAGLTGKWKKRRGPELWTEMDLTATPARQTPRSKQRDFGPFPGRWRVQFEKSEDPAVALFKADPKADQLHGTFLTTTGDYRYLAGTVEGDQLELSCFDGAHAFLFRANLQADGSLAGEFWSSDTWQEAWTAVRDDAAALPDAFGQTEWQPGSDLGQFSFPDLEGKPTRLNDPRFAADARIIYIFGSWCPNCHDAAAYFAELQEWYGEKLSIVGLAFELTGDPERDARQVKAYLERHGCTYPVLLAGMADKAQASEALPFLDRVRSYPTTIFLDRAGNVKAVHTGFSGPATGEAYLKQKQKFESLIDEIVAEAKKSP